MTLFRFPVDDSLELLSCLALASFARRDDFVVFGSAAIHLRGIDTGRDVGDVDVFFRRPIWARLFCLHSTDGDSYEGQVRTPRAGDPPFLEFAAEPPIHAFYEWTSRDAAWMTAERCFRNSEVVRGFRCVTLEEIRRHKRAADPNGDDREKHLSDLAVLDRVLS